MAMDRPSRFCRGPQPPGSPSLQCLLDGEAYAGRVKMADEPVAGKTRLSLDGEWSLLDLSSFGRQYVQVYSFCRMW